MTMTAPASEQSISWLEHVPVPLFAAVMGVGGLGLAWRKGHQTLGWPVVIGEVILIGAAFAFGLIAMIYLCKLARFPREVRNEFLHPIRVNFFPTISVSLLVLAGAALPYHQQISEGLWIGGTVMQLLFAIVIINRWLTRPVRIEHTSPAWFIPVVGNNVVPLIGVKLGYVEVSWFFFSIGLLFWLVLFGIVLTRIIYHEQLPAKALPTLFILLAPPSVGVAAYLQLNGGVFDGVAHILFGFALFVTMLLASMGRLFLSLPFGLSWWAFTFPSASMTIASMIYHDFMPGPVTAALAAGFLAATTVIISLVAARTVAAVISGELFIPE
jgi:tellurite resistance protein